MSYAVEKQNYFHLYSLSKVINTMRFQGFNLISVTTPSRGSAQDPSQPLTFPRSDPHFFSREFYFGFLSVHLTSKTIFKIYISFVLYCLYSGTEIIFSLGTFTSMSVLFT